MTRALVEGLDVDVSSAGTLDMPGERSPRELVAVATEAGLDLDSHRSRALSSVDLSDADLVIGFQQDHIASAVVEAKAPIDKTFLLPQLVRLLGTFPQADASDPIERARRAIERAHRVRQEESGRFYPGEEVADPIGRGSAAYRASAEEIRALTQTMVEALFGR